MRRKDFFKLLTLLPLTGAAMQLNSLQKLTEYMESTAKMPVLFVGHGSPMNAIEDTPFSREWKRLGATLPKPSAILCVSAHWETNGTFITAMDRPKTIHDFGGFPQELFDVQYPAKGAPVLAEETKKQVHKTSVGLDQEWGLDHGCWSILKHLYPKADVPVIQLSLDYTKAGDWHYELAKELMQLRSKGVLIIGSGNIVHNLRNIDWRNPENGYDWAIEANTKVKNLILSGDHKQLINYKSLGKSFEMAVPTPEHYLPLLYALGLKEGNDKVSFFNDKAVMGSLTMTSVLIQGS
jgi:4,5-DOPA dioxygenase extradiol